MSRLSYQQRRIRACDRVLRRLYWQLRHDNESDLKSIDEFQEKVQYDINWYEQTREEIEISL